MKARPALKDPERFPDSRCADVTVIVTEHLQYRFLLLQEHIARCAFRQTIVWNFPNHKSRKSAPAILEDLVSP